MGKPKLFKFDDLKNIPFVFDRKSGLKGKWASDFFKNDGDVVLELACGKGEYTRGMAELFPEKNFIGMDIKGNRIWSGSRLATMAGLENIAFVRDQIDHIDKHFAADEVSEIWITFADPFLKPSKWKKRLTAPRFLNLYKDLLKPGGIIHLKTDNDVLYEFTFGVIESEGHELIHNYNDIYSQGVSHLCHDITTHYESMHLKNGLTIKYVAFRLRGN